VKRRAFIMPMVLLLTLMVGVIVASLMERQSAYSLTSRRQVGQYESHHIARSINSAVEAWLQTVRGRPIREMIDSEGKLVEIRCDGGFGPRSGGSETLRLFLKDAQDRVRVDFAGLTGQTLQDAQRLVRAAKDALGDDLGGLSRALGPVAVSAGSASQELIEAAVSAATDSSTSGTGFVSTLLELRGQGPLTAQAFNQALIDGGFTPEQQASVARLVASDTTFWSLRVDVVQGDRVVDRYEGYLSSTPQGRGAGSGAATSRRGNVIGLERIRLDGSSGSDSRTR